MKVLILAPVNAISGGLLVAYQHAAWLERRGHSVCVAFSSDKLGTQIPSPLFSSLRTTLVRDLEKTKERFDLAIATWWETVFDLPRIQAQQFVYFVQTDERALYEDPLSPEACLIAETYRQKKIHFITEARWIQSFLKNEFDQLAHYAPNGVSLKLFQPDGPALSPRPKNSFRILIEGAGGLWFKRIDESFQVTQALRDRGLPIEVWYVCSDGVTRPEWKAEKVISKVPIEKMADIYRSCHALLKISAIEGFFGPPLEAMACGTAAVVSAVNGSDEYIEPGINALQVNLQNPVAEAITALETLIREPDRLSSLVRRGLATAQKMNWENQHSQFENALNAILNTLPCNGTPVAKDIQMNYRIWKSQVPAQEIRGLESFVHQLDFNLNSHIDALNERVARDEQRLLGWKPYRWWNRLKSALRPTAT